MPRGKASYALSSAAARDLAGIADYTIQNFGRDQAHRYRDSLNRAFELIAAHPRMGRDQSHLRQGYRRHSHASHVIFYRIVDEQIVVMRVLHSAQDPVRHLGKD